VTHIWKPLTNPDARASNGSPSRATPPFGATRPGVSDIPFPEAPTDPWAPSSSHPPEIEVARESDGKRHTERFGGAEARSPDSDPSWEPAPSLTGIGLTTQVAHP
jgi:hypothetical protein